MKKTLIGIGIVAIIIGGIYVVLRPQIEAMNATQIAVVGPGEPITFSIDGGKPITVSGKGRKIVEVSPGEHTVSITAPAALEYTVRTETAERWIVPGIAKQCYGKMDVSVSHYGKKTKAVAPTVIEVRSESAPFKLGKSFYLHPNAMPKRRRASQSVWLFRSASCQSLNSALKASKRIMRKRLKGPSKQPPSKH